MTSTPSEPTNDAHKPSSLIQTLTHANYIISTLTFFFIQRAITAPTAATFFLGWIGSEFVHLLMLAKAINIYILHRLNPQMFETWVGNALFAVNIYNFINMARTLHGNVASHEDFITPLVSAGIARKTGTRQPLWSAIISLIPMFAISRMFKPVTYKRNIPYASLQDTDPAIWKQVERASTTVKWRNVYMGRGFMEGWNKLDIVTLDPLPSTSLQPVIMYIHGGGWCVGDKLFAAYSTVSRIASRGIVVVTINYRLSPDVAFPAQIHDCKRALVWIKQNIAQYGGDPNCIFVMGESAGGHLTGLMGTTELFPPYQPPEAPLADTRVQGLICLYGVYDWEDTEGHLEVLYPSLVEGIPGGMKPFIERAILQKPYKGANKIEFAHASPTWHVRQKTQSGAAALPPFMVVHGTRDALTAYHDSKVFFGELCKFREKWPAMANGKPVRDVYVSVNEGHHAFGYLPSPRATALGDAVVDFVSHWGGGNMVGRGQGQQ